MKESGNRITTRKSALLSLRNHMVYFDVLGILLVTANFIVVSSASKPNQGIVAAIFNVALQVGGSVLGLAIMTAVAPGMDERYGSQQSHPVGQLSEIGYQSVYYSCISLCRIGLFFSLFAIKIPDDSSFSKQSNPSVPDPLEIPLKPLTQPSHTMSGAIQDPTKTSERQQDFTQPGDKIPLEPAVRDPT